MVMGGQPNYCDMRGQIAPVQNLPSAFQDLTQFLHVGEIDNSSSTDGFSEWLKKIFNVSLEQFMLADPIEQMKMMRNMTA